jgi:uncharacterized protein (DUF58 family)
VNLASLVLHLGFAGLLLAAVRHLYRDRQRRPWRFRLAAAPALLIALGVLSLTIGKLLSHAEGLSAFLLHAALLLAVLALLGSFLRIYPHRPLVYLALAPALLSLSLLVPRVANLPWIWAPLAIADGLAACVALADLLTLPRRGAFVVDREAGRVASLRQAHPVKLAVANQSSRSFFVWVRDGAPEELHPQPDEFRLRLAPRSRATMTYQAKSGRRGAFQLSSVHLRVRSRLGLWQRLLDYDVSSVIHVYPDMKQLGEYALLARTNRLNLLGVRRTRRIGQDNEFERLRDYTPDDNYKHIDWRSTARRRKLTVKDYQTNQSQRLIFLLDCGRMMTNMAGELSLLDHSLNAMLMLSYVALSHGDSVGLLCFSDEIHGFVPPASGMRQMNRLLHASFDRFPRLVESRYDQAFLYLATHCRKRSLVVLISNLIDEVNANQVGQYLRSFVGKHLPLGVLLRDRHLFEAADVSNPDDDALYRAAAAADILSWRQQVLADLEAKGVLSLDVFPEGLTAPLINRYLEIKARHLL